MTVPRRRSPYAGLRPFEEADTGFFFGREADTDVIAANLVAARLTVLYGPSGAGKSSVLRAGVAPRLRGLAGGPAVVVFSEWSHDPVAALTRAVAEEAAVEPLSSLVETVQAAVGARGELYLVLDQAEELFLYPESSFVEEFPELVTWTDLTVNVLLSIREDALATLDAFKSGIPDVLGNYLRLDRLDRAGGRAAVLGPLARYEELTGEAVTIEPELVEVVLDEVSEGRIDSGVGGRGVSESEQRSEAIEAPYLQLVLERLWDVERASGSDVIRHETLRELGGAQRIVAEHLGHATADLAGGDRAIVARLFHQLVTPSGSKIAHSAADLAEYTGVDEARLLSILSLLASRRVLRTLAQPGAGSPSYEIFHDVLADAVLDWRTRQETEQRLEREREEARRRHRRLAVVAIAALVALAVVSAIAVYALVQRSKAGDQARSARGRALTTSALLQLDRDPELALLLAREAERLAPSRSAEDALRSSLIAFRTRSLHTFDVPVIAAASAGGKTWSVDADGFLAGPRGRVRLDMPVRAASFDPEVVRVAVAGPGGVQVRNLRTGQTARVGPIAPGGKLALVAKRLAVARRTGRVDLIDLPSGAKASLFVPADPKAVALRSDGQVVVVANGHVVRVLLASGALVTRIEDRATVLGVAISPDGALLATAGADSAVRVWSLPTGALVNVMLGHRNLVTRVAFTSDGTQILSGSLDDTARAWDAANGRLLGVLTTGGLIRSLAATPDGRLAVTASDDGAVRLWETLGDPQLPVLTRLPRVATDLAVERGRILATAGALTYEIDRRTGKVTGRARAVASPSSFELDGKDVRYRAPDGATILLRGHANEVTSARYSPDRSLVVTASRDHDARIWNAATGKVLQVLRGHFAIVSDASFSPDGRWVVTAGPGTAGLFDVASGRLAVYLRGHAGILTSARFDPTGRTIVTTGADRTVRSYRCVLCGGGAELLRFADRRLRAIGRVFSPVERRRYLEGTG